MMDSLMIQQSAFADLWSQWCLSSLIGSSAVLIIVLLAWRFVCRNRSPQLLSLLFLLVLLKPFVPVSITIPQVFASRLPIAIDSKPIATADPLIERRPVAMNEFVVQPAGAAEATSAISASVDVSQSTKIHSTANTATALSPPALTASWRLVLFSLYCLVLTGLLLRFLVIQFRFHRLVGRAATVPLSTLPFDLPAACKRAGLRTTPRVVEMEAGSPAVWGVFRPTLILPHGLITDLSIDSLRWTVMHELAHLKRRDIVLHGIQRLLTLVQFWNPAAWIASSMINRFREQACDDMALVWCDRQTVSAGEAFMHVVRTTSQHKNKPQTSSRPVAASLGVFSSGSKRACTQRLSRLLDADRPLREKMGSIACLALLVASVVLLPRLRTAVAAPPTDVTVAEPSTADEPEPFVAAKDVGEFELVIVGPNNEPIPNADVEIRPKTTEPWTFLLGSFKKDGSYGTYTQTDAKGRLKLKLPKRTKYGFRFSIKAPGYGLFWAQWRAGDQSEVMPAKYVAHLDAGQSVGGIIVDSNGKPIVGAKVHPSIEYKKRETDESQLGSGWRATTDKDGKWRCDFVPASYDHLSVEIVHSDFVPTNKRLELPKYRLGSTESPSQLMQIDRGITLTGKITNQAGDPIPDANVRVVVVNETLSTTTDAEGNYRMPGCPPGSQAITVTAKTYSPDQKVVMFANSLAPVDFQLQPGHTVRVRVIDKDGNPQKKARIFFRSWREDVYGKGLGTVLVYTDENGIWEWNDAPADSFIADVCPVGCITIGNQFFKAREKEYVYQAMKQLVISGNVVDATSKQPIESFRVVPGLVWEDATEPYWVRRDSFDSRNGKFTLNQKGMDARHAVRIEAVGYLPVTSRFIKVDEGQVSIDFQLQRAAQIQVIVTRPDGSPAVGAEAAIGVPGSQIGVRNGSFSNTSAKRVKVDSAGLLALPPDASAIRLVILDEAGFADVAIEPNAKQTKLTLTPWVTVHGTLVRNNQPASGVNLSLSPNQSRPIESIMDISWHDSSATDKNGHYRFDRVRPGKASLYQEIITHNTGRSSQGSHSHRVHITTQPGEDKTLNLGGHGYSVVGHATAKLDGDSAIDWEFSTLSITPDVGPLPTVPYPPGLPDSEKAAWYKNWSTSPAGQEFVELQNKHFLRFIQSYGSKIEPDGKLHVDNVPPGKYLLKIQLDSRPAKSSFASDQLGSVEVPFEISTDHNRQDPVDMGTLIVK